MRESQSDVDTLARIAPGLAMLRGYRREWLRTDLAAGLSVAAVALPTAIAYAELAGFPPVVGLYAVVAYVLNLNGIISENETMNAETLPKVMMPNRDGFITFTRGR